MPYTDNPPYIGIVPVILAIFALVYRRNRMTWFLAIFSVIVLFLSFGRYLPVLYDLFYHYFPYFNKFRAPSLILFLIPLTVGLLAVYGLSWIIDAGRAGRPGATGPATPNKALLRWMIALAGVFILAFVGRTPSSACSPRRRSRKRRNRITRRRWSSSGRSGSNCSGATS